jgi:hypothetical protein
MKRLFMLVAVAAMYGVVAFGCGSDDESTTAKEESNLVSSGSETPAAADPNAAAPAEAAPAAPEQQQPAM